jgi:hypothetical protein
MVQRRSGGKKNKEREHLMKKGSWLPIGMTTLYLVLIVFSFLVVPARGCMAEPEQALRALDQMGYTEAKIHNHAWFWVAVRGCGADAARFDATAVNPRGKRVDLIVCVGWPFKGSTVRTW